MKTKYQLFQEWLDRCPVEITDYKDYSTEFEINFEVPLEVPLEDDGDGVELENVTDEWYDEDGNIKHE